MLVVAGVGIGIWVTRGGGGGDPGNRVFSKIESDVRSAAPGGLSVGAARPAAWSAGCDGLGHSWTEVYVSGSFLAVGSRTKVEAEVGAKLQSDGWVRRDAHPNTHTGLVAHWLQLMPGGGDADVWTFPSGTAPNEWFISGSWQPPGPTTHFC